MELILSGAGGDSSLTKFDEAVVARLRLAWAGQIWIELDGRYQVLAAEVSPQASPEAPLGASPSHLALLLR